MCIFEADYQGHPTAFIGVAESECKIGDECTVCIRGHMWKSPTPMSANWIGKKIYLVDPFKHFPENLSSNATNGVFFGTCLQQNIILVGL
jgi:hypothetical protein